MAQAVEKEPRSVEIPASQETIKQTLEAWWNLLHQRRGVGKNREDYAGVWPRITDEPELTIQPSTVRYTTSQVAEFAKLRLLAPNANISDNFSVEGITYANISKSKAIDVILTDGYYGKDIEQVSFFDREDIPESLELSDYFQMHVLCGSGNDLPTIEFLTYYDMDEQIHSIKRVTSKCLNPTIPQNNHQIVEHASHDHEFAITQTTESEMQTILSILQEATVIAKKDHEASFVKQSSLDIPSSLIKALPQRQEN